MLNLDDAEPRQCWTYAVLDLDDEQIFTARTKTPPIVKLTFASTVVT